MKKKKKIIVIDDDDTLLEVLKILLENENYLVSLHSDSTSAMEHLDKETFAAAFIDLKLRNVGGKTLVKAIRSKGLELPIIILTADDSDKSLVECLEYGADDYITKPFEIDVLTARLKAILRRADGKRFEDKKINIGKITIDTEKIEVSRNGKIIDLTAIEYKLLEFFAQNKGKVLSRAKLLDRIWGTDNLAQDRVVDVHIANLRRKINEDFEERLKIVDTIRGFGYRVIDN